MNIKNAVIPGKYRDIDSDFMSDHYNLFPYSLFEYPDCPRNKNVSGYGNKIPCPYGVAVTGDKIIRRVYAICHSNVASYYFLYQGIRCFIPDTRFGWPKGV